MFSVAFYYFCGFCLHCVVCGMCYSLLELSLLASEVVDVSKQVTAHRKKLVTLMNPQKLEISRI